MLLLLSATSIMGQGRVQYCECAKEVTLNHEAECGSCEHRGSQEEGNDSRVPCQDEECVTVLAEAPLSTLPPILHLEIDAPSAPAPLDLSYFDLLSSPQEIEPFIPSLPPKNPPGTELIVLHLSFLI